MIGRNCPTDSMPEHYLRHMHHKVMLIGSELPTDLMTGNFFFFFSRRGHGDRRRLSDRFDAGTPSSSQARRDNADRRRPSDQFDARTPSISLERRGYYDRNRLSYRSDAGTLSSSQAKRSHDDRKNLPTDLMLGHLLHHL